MQFPKTRWIAVVLCAAGVTAGHAQACSVWLRPTSAAFASDCAKSDVVCIAEVIDKVGAPAPTRENPTTWTFHRLKVLQTWKGSSPDTLRIGAGVIRLYSEDGENLCGIRCDAVTMTPGERHLLYIRLRGGDSLEVMLDQTKLTQAHAELYWLQHSALPVTRAAADPTVVPVVTIRSLVRGLSDPDTLVQRHSASTLEAIGDSIPVCLPAVLQCIRSSPAASTREKGCCAIMTWAEGSAEAATAYRSLLRDGDASVRSAAVASYQSAGPVRGDEILWDALTTDPDPRVRAGAARWAGESVSVGATSAALLLEALDDPDARVRRAAAAGLISCRTDLDSVVAALLARLSDPDPKVAEAAFRSWRSLTGQ